MVLPSDARGRTGTKAIETPWITRAIPTPGAVATATATAEDGHELSADLYGKGHRLGEPHSLLVVAHPVTESDGVRVRHPTFSEVLDAADLLAPGDVFHIVFIACPPGVTREPEEVDGARGVQADQCGEAKKSPLIHTARA